MLASPPTGPMPPSGLPIGSGATNQSIKPKAASAG
eukprot:CAMPEP_0202413592 /NCGR_PEP_ID=MMETSP1128-20130828/30001_1 /ASSEMBLY_ACC=CAM_ASM_000463 /TAXON_ID=3047 /ORGANISM="Dunaliella tertiolecta, Strain CCMP1320" /LENGTH=34 /DNA_ID= /DNA_START= /DNA_END= /DNA_ORIENTATION=